MTALIDLLERPDLCALPLTIGLLWWFGRKVIALTPELRSWGLRLAAFTFVAYAVYALVTSQPMAGGVLPVIALRALLAAGLMLGITWILLPPASIASRSALAAFKTWQQRTSERRQRQAEKLAGQAAAIEASRHAEAQRRRAAARAQCEMLWTLRARARPSFFTRATRRLPAALSRRRPSAGRRGNAR